MASVLFEFSLPNAATWFFFSFVLVMTVYFKFDRLLTLRNWDVLSLFLLVPGLLIIQEAHALRGTLPPEHQLDRLPPKLAKGDHPPSIVEETQARVRTLLLTGYIWLLTGTAYFFGRCCFDLGLERRPAFTPNLNMSGLLWLGGALILCLTAAAIRRIPDSPEKVGRGSVAINRFKVGAAAVVEGQAPAAGSTRVVWVERTVAVGLHLTILAALILIGRRHFNDLTSGVAIGCLYTLLPYTAYHVIQIHHIWPTAFVVWAIVAYPRPGVAGALLGIAAGSTFFPLLLFPLWFGFYRQRGAGTFAVGFLVALACSLAITAAMLLSTGELNDYLRVTMNLSDWQAWKAPQTEGLWRGLHWAYRLPVFILYLAFVVLTMFWPTPRSLAQVIAQSAAVIIGVQFWYADQGGVYILWYLPLLLLVIFRPTLNEVRPPPRPSRKLELLSGWRAWGRSVWPPMRWSGTGEDQGQRSG